jgi:hypothetical protein
MLKVRSESTESGVAYTKWISSPVYLVWMLILCSHLVLQHFVCPNFIFPTWRILLYRPSSSVHPPHYAPPSPRWGWWSKTHGVGSPVHSLLHRIFLLSNFLIIRRLQDKRRKEIWHWPSTPQHHNVRRYHSHLEWPQHQYAKKEDNIVFFLRTLRSRYWLSMNAFSNNSI